MTFEERMYKTLVVSSTRKFYESIAPLLNSAGCEPITFADSIASAKRHTLESSFDFVIINAPLSDEIGTKYAIDLSTRTDTVCMLFVRAEQYTEIKAKVSSHGVFTLSKPASGILISTGLSFLSAARERLRNLEEKTLSIEEKMKEIRLVNRAKWLLIDNLKMTESDAHRYLEKQAMDRCTARIEIAKEIIRTYS